MTMKASNRMQKLRLATQSLTESVEQNLSGNQDKEYTVGCIEHEVKIIRKDYLLLLKELRNPETRK